MATEPKSMASSWVGDMSWFARCVSASTVLVFICLDCRFRLFNSIRINLPNNSALVFSKELS
jgi:hypothetical protein